MFSFWCTNGFGEKDEPSNTTPTIKITPFDKVLNLYKLNFDKDSPDLLLRVYFRIFEEISSESLSSINQVRVFLTLKLFNATFTKSQSHGNTGEKL